jgi:Putative zincin peptidase
MRFHWGTVPKSPDFEPLEPWKPLKEPSPWLFQFMAVPVGIAATLGVGILWLILTPLRHVSQTPSPMGLVLSFPLIMVVHELIHAAAHPSAGRSSQSILGFWPSRMIGYAHYDGELTRNRFVVILLMPLFVISFLPLLVAAIARVASGWAAFVSVFNTLLACGDILAAGIVLFQLPAGTIVRNQGWWTYWKVYETPISSQPA